MRVRIIRGGREVAVHNFSRDDDARAEYLSAMDSYPDCEVKLEQDTGAVVASVGPGLKRRSH